MFNMDPVDEVLDEGLQAWCPVECGVDDVRESSSVSFSTTLYSSSLLSIISDNLGFISSCSLPWNMVNSSLSTSLSNDSRNVFLSNFLMILSTEASRAFLIFASAMICLHFHFVSSLILKINKISLILFVLNLHRLHVSANAAAR